MYSLVLRYAAALLVLVVLDALWLDYIAQGMFRSALGNILLDDPRWGAAALFYLFYAGGVVVFAVSPALRSNSWVTAFGFGALFGFLAYMTYDLTNLTTIKMWSWKLAAVDIGWGSVLTGLAATASFEIATWMTKSR